MSRLHCTQAVGATQTALLDGYDPEIRMEKVLEIRKRLREGRYSIKDRLDIVIERILMSLS
ncbi:MAG: hypothetical protein GX448_01710 [Planctomycetes bacterium]|jgi:anti-sigma28 factor (negative regulator of flagellin synthesis)|nr:hypothetical protein [Planctomycetota bacterium]